MRRAGRAAALLAEDDVDPIAFVPNLFDAILVLTVAALVTLTAARATASHVPDDSHALQGFVDTGVQKAGQGQRLGVAYRLADGRLIYVPE